MSTLKPKLSNDINTEITYGQYASHSHFAVADLFKEDGLFQLFHKLFANYLNVLRADCSYDDDFSAGKHEESSFGRHFSDDHSMEASFDIGGVPYF